MNEGAVAICLFLGVAAVLWVIAVLFVFGYPIPGLPAIAKVSHVPN
jgi:hypothetical protein